MLVVAEKPGGRNSTKDGNQANGLIPKTSGRGEIGRRAGFRFLWVTPCGFKSLRPHHERVIILIQKVSRLLPFLLLLGVFLPYFRLLTVVLTVKSRFLVAPTFFTHPQIVKIMR